MDNKNKRKKKQKGKDVSKGIMLGKTNTFISDGCYFEKVYTKNGIRIERLSNFLIKGLYLLKSDNPSFSKRILSISNTDGKKHVIVVSVKDLVGLGNFLAEIEGRGSFILYANRQQFNVIKEFEVMKKEKTAIELKILGYQKEHNFFAFANGIYADKFYPVDEYGLVTYDDDIYYIPALSEVNKNANIEFHNERKLIFQSSDIGFEKWSELIVAAYGGNGIIGISFMIATIFRDIIFDHLECFPILFLFGPPAMGKSTFTESFQRLFGEPQSPIGLGSASSSKGFSRKLAQFRNIVVVFEEYKNAIKPALIEMLKNVFDGIGYERAQMTNDNKTHSTPVLSACIVPGQQMPTKESALFSRVLMCEFKNNTFDDATAAAYTELKEWEQEGLGNVIGEILQQRSVLKKMFKDTYKSIFKTLKADKLLESLSDRNVKKMASILTPIKVLMESPKSMVFPFLYNQLYSELRVRLLIQSKVMERVNEVNEFWGIFENLVDKGCKLNNGFDFLIEGSPGNKRIFLSFDNVYPLYGEAASKRNLDVLDKETLRSYLKMQSYFIPYSGKGKGDSFKKRFSDGKQRSCYCFALDSIPVEQDVLKTKGDSNSSNID